MSECVFCDITAGHAEASIVYEDEYVLAFMDIQPVTTGHVLVIPRRHMPYLNDVPPAIAAHMFIVGQSLAAALRRSRLPCDGVNIFLADGKAAFQEVFHTHLHVFPRMEGDGFRIEADWQVRPRVELEDAARAVREGLGT